MSCHPRVADLYQYLETRQKQSKFMSRDKIRGTNDS